MREDFACGDVVEESVFDDTFKCFVYAASE